MSTSARIQICLYDEEKVTAELRWHPDMNALMFSIEGAGAGFCISGPPERVREALTAIALVAAGEASNASAAQRPPDSSVAETPEEEH